MLEHWLRGEEVYSNVAIAAACGVNEKTVRQWRGRDLLPGEVPRPIPVDALVHLPSALFDEVVTIVARLRGRTPKRAVALLRQALRDLPAQIANEDASEVVRELVDAQGKIAGLVQKAIGERR